jgi:hypothetical protein
MVSETTLSKQLPSVPAVYEEGNGSSPGKSSCSADKLRYKAALCPLGFDSGVLFCPHRLHSYFCEPLRVLCAPLGCRRTGTAHLDG